MRAVDAFAWVLIGIGIGFAVMGVAFFNSPVFERGNETIDMTCVSRDVETGRCTTYTRKPEPAT